MDKKVKIIIGVVIGLIVIGVGVWLIFFNKDTKKEETKNENTTKSEIPLGVKVTNDKATVEGDIVSYVGDLTNTNKETINVKSVDIILKDSEGKVITTLKSVLNIDVAKDEVIQISSQAQITAGKEIKKIDYVIKTK